MLQSMKLNKNIIKLKDKRRQSLLEKDAKYVHIEMPVCIHNQLEGFQYIIHYVELTPKYF